MVLNVVGSNPTKHPTQRGVFHKLLAFFISHRAPSFQPPTPSNLQRAERIEKQTVVENRQVLPFYISSGMKLHLFNPSHDEALAAHSPYYYPSGAARKLAVEWCLLPAIWAEAGDAVWIPEEATKPDGEKTETNAWGKELNWLHTRELTAAVWNDVEEIVPWGWDLLLCHQLRKAGAPERLLPQAEELQTLRTLSSRQTTTEVLPLLKEALKGFPLPLVGESFLAHSEAEVLQQLEHHPTLMVKALWSCSGRGVFRIHRTPTASECGRIRKLIREQGAVELQPAYERDTDFALEFTATATGEVRCEGFSHFVTHPTGQYAGNLVTSPEALAAQTTELIGSAEAVGTLCHTMAQQFSHYLAGRYVGPLGVDLMTVRTETGKALMPCVEVNLRRTMGHTALHLAQKMDEGQLKATDIPMSIRKLWYFCAQYT